MSKLTFRLHVCEVNMRYQQSSHLCLGPIPKIRHCVYLGESIPKPRKVQNSKHFG